jgi:hypothetical protein
MATDGSPWSAPRAGATRHGPAGRRGGRPWRAPDPPGVQVQVATGMRRRAGLALLSDAGPPLDEPGQEVSGIQVHHCAFSKQAGRVSEHWSPCRSAPNCLEARPLLLLAADPVGPARGYQRAGAGHARAHRRGPRRPASALTSSRRPARHVGRLRRPDRVPGDRDRGRATFAPSGRGASLRRQCPERCGTVGETSRPPARHRRRQIAQQLRPVPRGRLLQTGRPRRPAPATRRRDVQPNADGWCR